MADNIAASDRDRRQAIERALHESERQFRLLVDSVVDYAIFMLAADGRIVTWNTGATRIKGYSAGEIIGQSHSKFYTEEDRAKGMPALALAAAREHGRYEAEGWRVRKDGSRFWASVVVNAIRGDDGNLIGFSKVTRDITERKGAHDARFRQVVEAAPNAIVMINSSGQIEMVNAQAEQIFGYPRAEMLGRHVEMLVPHRFRANHPGLRQSFLADPDSRPMGAGRDLFGLRKDGSEFPIEIGLNPIETDEGPLVLSAIVDISDRKQKEERIQAALKEKDVLLGEVHHRVKNNLQIVHSLLDLQSSRITDRNALNMLRDSQNRIRAMGLIHQTLYQSKDFATVDFRHFLDALVPTLVASYGVNPDRIALSVEAAQVLLPIHAAMPCGLFVNELISNALKHAFPDGRRGEIAVKLFAEPPGRAVLSVADNGVGIPEDVDMSKTSTLGLQLVALLADQLGGTITKRRSNPTEFVLSFAIAT